MPPTKDLISVQDLDSGFIEMIFDQAEAIKRWPEKFATHLKGKYLAMLFEKSSLRTRFTFDIGMTSLGGLAVFMDCSKEKLGERESIADIGRNLERWCHGVVARTYSHRAILELANSCSIPVINGLSDLMHPCQALTDFFTLREKLGPIKGLKMAYVGDPNNTCRSLMHGAAKLGIDLTVVCPEAFAPDAETLFNSRQQAATTGGQIRVCHDLAGGVAGCDVIYTDTWISMGQETEAEKRREMFAPYQVTQSVLRSTGRDTTYFMHCLPAHRGQEVSAAVIDSPHSLVFDQAENRLHVQKAILSLLMGAGARK
ncbi:MAG: ornithine carbamoyltransferase [Acidobacteriota bacterium]